MNSKMQKKKSSLKKNLVLLATIFLLILIVRSLIFLLKNPDADVTPGTSTYSSSNSSITITVPNRYDFKVVEDSSYLLQLRSTKISSNIFVSEKTMSPS